MCLHLFQAGQYLMPGLIHTFKEDGGILSIGAGLGYTFNGPVKRENHRLVLIASKWGSAKLLSAFFLYYLEMHNNGEHSTIGTLLNVLLKKSETQAKQDSNVTVDKSLQAVS